MNAFLVRHQIDFSKMHNNDRFLERISTVDATLAATLSTRPETSGVACCIFS